MVYKTHKRDWAHTHIRCAAASTIYSLFTCPFAATLQPHTVCWNSGKGMLCLLQCAVVGSVHHGLACIEINLHAAVLLTACSGRVVGNRLRAALARNVLEL